MEQTLGSLLFGCVAKANLSYLHLNASLSEQILHLKFDILLAEMRKSRFSVFAAWRDLE